MTDAAFDMDTLKPAIGYIRVSMAREEMISPELQRKAISAWAKRTNHRIVDWIEDLDKTGRNFKRRVMEAIERIERGEVRVIAVWKYSRFGRSRTGVPANLARVEKAGGELLSATEEVDARTAIGRFQRGMIMEFNAFESDRAGEQWQETHQWRRDNGLPATGRPRFGYLWHPRMIHQPDGSILLQEEKYLPDEKLKPIIETLYTRSAGGEGFATLAAWLNNQGYKTVRGELWSDRTLTSYMDSGFAAGYLRLHDPACTIRPYRWNCPNHLLVRHETKGHDAIISPELWADYLLRRKLVRGMAVSSRGANYPLTGLARCGLCGAAAHRKRDGRRYVQFVCSARRAKGEKGCSGATTTVAHAEYEVQSWLADVDREIELDAAQIRSNRVAPVPEVDAKRAETEARIVKLERAISRHMRVFAMSEDEDTSGSLEAEYLATLRSLKSEKATLVQELSSLTRKPTAEETAAQRAALQPIIKSLAAEWDTLEPARLNMLLRQLVERVEIYPQGRVEVVPTWADADPGASIH